MSGVYVQDSSPHLASKDLPEPEATYHVSWECFCLPACAVAAAAHPKSMGSMYGGHLAFLADKVNERGAVLTR